MASRTQVFVSYSHRDKKWLERLQVHLTPLQRSGAIDLWDDTRVSAGDVWRREMAQALAATRVAILLVSADFLASDFIAESELPSLLAAAEKKGVEILPVIVSASLYEETPELARFKPVNPPSQPLIGMRPADQEALLEKVARTVLGLLPGSEPTNDGRRTWPESRLPRRVRIRGVLLEAVRAAVLIGVILVLFFLVMKYFKAADMKPITRDDVTSDRREKGGGLNESISIGTFGSQGNSCSQTRRDRSRAG